MKFDTPGIAKATVVLYRDGRECRFPMPFETNSPDDVALLAAFPLTQEVKERVAAPPVFEPLPPFDSTEERESKPLKPSGKEV